MKKTLPENAQTRKTIPVYSGLIVYFREALALVAHLSYKGNEQHNPGKPLHWDRSKSADELDALLRHVLDDDWVHVAWRALANLQKQTEKKGLERMMQEIDQQFAQPQEIPHLDPNELEKALARLTIRPKEKTHYGVGEGDENGSWNH